MAWLISTTPGRITATLTTISAILGIIVGVNALIPKPPDALTASFSRVTARPEVSLEEYDSRAQTQITGSTKTAYVVGSSYRLASYTTPTSDGEREGEGTTSGTVPRSISTTTNPNAETGVSTSTQSNTSSTSTTPTPATTTGVGTTTGTGIERPTKARRRGGRISLHPHEVPYPQEKSEQQVRSTSLAAPAGEGQRSVAGAEVTEGAGVPKAEVSGVFGLLAAPSHAPAPTEPSTPTEPSITGSAPPSRAEAQPSTGASARGGAPIARIVLPASCRTHGCGATQEAEKALTYDPNPIRAAQAVSAMFNGSRREVVGKHYYPLGAEVSYDVTVRGFAHRHVTLEWSLAGNAGKHRLARPWWRNIVFARITPAVPEQSFQGRFWLPEPPEHGEYTVELTLLDEHGIPYGGGESSPAFH